MNNLINTRAGHRRTSFKLAHRLRKNELHCKFLFFYTEQLAIVPICKNTKNYRGQWTAPGNGALQLGKLP
jgi:hypothetical protein